METSVMKVLNHPGMIKLIETVETKSAIYIVTELVKDGDLFEYIVHREFLEGIFFQKITIYNKDRI